MAAGRIILPTMPALDLNGNTISGAQIYFYEDETTVAKAVYTTAALNVAHAQPVVADAAGTFPEIFADTTEYYSVVAYTPTGVMLPHGSFSAVSASVSVVDVSGGEAEAAAAAAEAAAAAAEAAAELAEAALDDATAALAAAAGVTAFYDTKALANAALAGLAANVVVMVFADESQSGARTIYRKESGAYVLKATLSSTFAMDATTAAGAGVFTQGGVRLLHTWTDPTNAADNNNAFFGKLAGNLTMGPAGGGAAIGARNVGFGFKALNANTTGWQNTAIGYVSLWKNTTGLYNTAVGAWTLIDNLTGSNNTAVGSDALWKSLLDNNTAVGSYAGQQVVGSNNTALGKSALQYGNTCDGNVAIGYHALKGTGDDTAGTLTGDNNVAVGKEVMTGLINGTNNTGVGNIALVGTTNGSNNTAIGAGAGQNLTTDTCNNNTVVGALTMSNAVAGAAGNTVVGQGAANALTTGDDNVIIGFEAGPSITTGARNIVIGASATVANGNDQLNIGGLLKGSLALKLLQIVDCPTYADNAAAVTGGLAVDTVYATATGELRIVV